VVIETEETAMSNWPKREDGTNKTMGEMTKEERREQTTASLLRLKAEFEEPKMQKALADWMNGTVN
jgi:hypothetical protein